jgi:hypothetical protein
MRTQWVLLGHLVIDREPPIDLGVELPVDKVVQKAATLKDRLAFLLDTRFRPSQPEPRPLPGLTVEDVASLLHCRCRTVLRMVKRGELHPISDEDSELYFDREEVANLAHLPLSDKLSRLIPRKLGGE